MKRVIPIDWRSAFQGRMLDPLLSLSDIERGPRRNGPSTINWLCLRNGLANSRIDAMITIVTVLMLTREKGQAIGGLVIKD